MPRVAVVKYHRGGMLGRRKWIGGGLRGGDELEGGLWDGLWEEEEVFGAAIRSQIAVNHFPLFQSAATEKNAIRVNNMVMAIRKLLRSER